MHYRLTVVNKNYNRNDAKCNISKCQFHDNSCFERIDVFQVTNAIDDARA